MSWSGDGTWTPDTASGVISNTGFATNSLVIHTTGLPWVIPPIAADAEITMTDALVFEGLFPFADETVSGTGNRGGFMVSVGRLMSVLVAFFLI